MKKFIAAALLFTATITLAQEAQKKQPLTVEQRTELQVKKMTLNLDLNEKQQKEMKALMLEQNTKLDAMRKERAAKRAEAEKMSQEDRLKMKNAIIDEQIAFKAKVKKVLTEDQYVKWDAQREHRKDILKSQAIKEKRQRKAVKEEK